MLHWKTYLIGLSVGLVGGFAMGFTFAIEYVIR